jgi:hypothetical protein
MRKLFEVFDLPCMVCVELDLIFGRDREDEDGFHGCAHHALGYSTYNSSLGTT